MVTLKAELAVITVGARAMMTTSVPMLTGVPEVDPVTVPVPEEEEDPVTVPVPVEVADPETVAEELVTVADPEVLAGNTVTSQQVV